MMRALFWYMAGTMVAGACFASDASTTGGSIGNLMPAPKFLKGSIKDNIYSGPDHYFSVRIPHDVGSYEYQYTKIKEQFADDGDYLSFGPAALDQCIYRLDIAKRHTPNAARVTLDASAPAEIDHYKSLLTPAYKGELRQTAHAETAINGRRALYYRFEQIAAPGRLVSHQSVTIVHEAYLIEFGKAVALVWVQIPQLKTASGIDPKAFAESLVIRGAIDTDGYYRFQDHPVEIKGPLQNNCFLTDTNSSVDFVASGGDWRVAGQYAVQVFKQTPQVSTKEQFLTYCRSGSVARFIENDRKNAGFRFKVLKTEEIDLGGRAAVRGVGVDRDGKNPAVFLVTAVQLDTRLVFASLILPLDSAKNTQLDSLDSWSDFNRWVNTIKEPTTESNLAGAPSR